MEAKPSHALPRSNKQLDTTTDTKAKTTNICAHAATHKAKSKDKVAHSYFSVHSQEPLGESFILTKKCPTFGQLEINIGQNMRFFHLKKP
jgi:hypothetical protein